MAWSKSSRIITMVVICTVFFFIELISGYLIHSLALLADAFHMLNDIISLLVGLWAVSVARRATTDKFSYGWLRAEILGAFFNATFLIALCVSIVLEAVTRFFDPPEISNPKVMLIVGCFGLASNLVGFVILGGHGHGHDHGHEEGHKHAHGHDHGTEAGDEHRLAEEGRGAAPRTNADVADERGDIVDVLPQVAVARAASVPPRNPARQSTGDDAGPTARDAEARHSNMAGRGRSHRRATGPAHHARLASIDDLSIYPSSFREEIIDASRSNTSFGQPMRSSSSSSESGPDEHTALLGSADRTSKAKGRNSSPVRRRRRDSEALHTDHHHNKPKSKGKGGHGHSHGDMGMNAMVLHVLGDALGNVGVIITALVIWLTEWRYKLYTDPLVSLFITMIILRSALPLTSATARVLLQATPEHIDINELRQDIQTLPGVLSCHHIHVWQLSDTKIVASMHMQVAFPISEEGGEKYMELAKRARKCLHAYGIHSATIQPEFCPDKSQQHVAFAPVGRGPPPVDGPGDQPAVVPGTEEGRIPMCLLECVEDCDEEGCCSVLSTSSSSRRREWPRAQSLVLGRSRAGSALRIFPGAVRLYIGRVRGYAGIPVKRETDPYRDLGYRVFGMGMSMGMGMDIGTTVHRRNHFHLIVHRAGVDVAGAGEVHDRVADGAALLRNVVLAELEVGEDEGGEEGEEEGGEVTEFHGW